MSKKIKKKSKSSKPIKKARYEPYKVKATGLQFYPNSTDDPIRVADPIYIDGWFRYEAAEDENELYLRYYFYDQSNRKVKGQVSRDELMSPKALFKQLFKCGYGTAPLSEANCQHLANYLLQSVPTKVTILTPHICWRGKKFGWPGRTREHNGQFYRYEKASNAHPIDLTKAGTWQEWTAKVFSLVLYSDLLVFAVGLAFAALVRRQFTDEPGGGYHIVGPSSNGKSLTLMVATSISGKPGSVTTPTWETTANALEETIIQHADVLLCLDDTGHLEKLSASEAAAMVQQAAFGNGRQAKRRSKRNGTPVIGLDAYGEQAADALLLSTGEKSTREIIRAGGLSSLPGADVRLVNIRIRKGERDWGIFDKVKNRFLESDMPDEEMSREMANLIDQACKTYFGSVGRRFTKYISENFDDAKSAFLQYRAEFQKSESEHTTAVAQRIKNRVGLSYAGNMLAMKAGILPDKKKRFMRVTKGAFANAMENITSPDPLNPLAEHLKQLKALAKKIEEATELTPAQKAETFDGFTDDGQRYAGKILLKEKALRELAGTKPNLTRLLKEITDIGCLPPCEPGKKRTIVYEKKSVPGRPRVYPIDMSPLADI